MKNQNDHLSGSDILRQKAEELLNKKSSVAGSQLSEIESLKLMHELEVHQIELEMQNQELKLALSAAQDAIDLFDFAPIGYLILTNNGEIHNLNHCASQMLGRERQHLINKRVGLWVSDDTRPVFNLFLDKIFSSQARETCEVTLMSKGSSPTFVELTGYIHRQGNQCLVTAVELTGKKLAEENLKESEEKFRTVVEEANEIIFTTDNKGYFTYVNPRGIKVSGYSLDELKQIKYLDIIEPEYKPIVKRNYFKQYVKRIALSTTEYPFRTKSGEIKWFSQNASLILENNMVKGFYVIARDITELRKAELALKDSEEKYRLIVENIGDGFGFVNPEEKFVIANHSADEIFGVAPGGLVGMNLNQFLSKEQFSMVQKETEIRTHGIKSIYELDIVRPGGEKRAISITAVPQNDKDGIFIGTYGIFRDITESKQIKEALLESEMKYRELVENSPDAIVIYVEGKIVYANNECSRLMAASATEELIGKSVLQFIHPDYREFVFERMRAAASGGTILPLVEEKFVRLDGSTVDVEVKSFPIKFGNKPATQLIVREITERKEAESVLHFQAEIIKNISEAIYLVRIDDGEIVYSNSQFEKMFGYGPGEMLGKHASIVNAPGEKDPEETAREILNHLKQNGFWNGEVLNIRKDGTPFWSYAKVSVFEHSQFGKVLIAVHEDITERKQAEETLRASQQLIEGIINAMPVRIFWKDRNSVYLGCNKIFANDAGFSDPKDLIGKDDFQMGWRDQAELYRSGDRQVMESGNPILLNEEPQATPEGNTIILLTNKIPLINSMGEINGILGTSMNVTERISAMQEIKLKNEQLLKTNAEKDKFFSIIAHDLKSPFNGFLGLTQIMAEELPSLTMAQVQELAISMKNSATNLYSLLENLLKWSQMQQGAIDSNPQFIQLRPILDESIEMVLEPAKNKGIEITFDIQDNTVVFADINMLQTIIRNLVSNAVKFTTRGGKISLSAKIGPNNHVEISVRDTGIGMSREMVDNLFRPDIKTNRKGTEGEPSTGLGLLLCKEFIEKNGGRIWVESDPDGYREGKGSAFCFTLPMNTRQEEIRIT